ncbi:MULTISPECIES: hypothetical protein [unclassified Microcoleus]|uniref:hypothetical protein n=1 Tax=unclassified Microcoleus TaxID=2642155 RepID=UPI002FD6E235
MPVADNGAKSEFELTPYRIIQICRCRIPGISAKLSEAFRQNASKSVARKDQLD